MGRKKGQKAAPQSSSFTVDARQIGVVRNLSKKLAVKAMTDEKVMPLAKQAAEFVKALEQLNGGEEDVLS